MNRFLCIILTLFVLLTSSGAALGSTSSVLAAKEEIPRLVWREKRIEIAISRALLSASPNIKAGSDVAGAIRRSIEAWQDVAAIELVTLESTKQDVSPAGFAGDGVNLITIAASPENVLFFGKDPYSASAKTRIFYTRRGSITEADIVLNPFQLFSTDGSFGTFDLESTLRHEIGHLLGLRHSAVVGAAMYDSATKNGVFGTLNNAVGLTADDIAAVRALYGSTEPEEDCCGSIAGRLNGPNRAGREYVVWAQETSTGRLVANTITDRSRSFRLDGLSDGESSVFAVESGKAQTFSPQSLGDAKVAKGTTTTLSARYVRQPINFSLQLLGANGILSDSPIVLSRGTSQRIYAGGSRLTDDRIRIESDSPFLSVSAESSDDIQFDADLTGVSFLLRVDPETPSGQYNIMAISADGTYDIRIGAITVK